LCFAGCSRLLLSCPEEYKKKERKKSWKTSAQVWPWATRPAVQQSQNKRSKKLFGAKRNGMDGLCIVLGTAAVLCCKVPRPACLFVLLASPRSLCNERDMAPPTFARVTTT
jgi:hypothetical protein